MVRCRINALRHFLFEQIWTGVFLRYDNLSGARFGDRPLTETRHAITAGIGVAWLPAHSQRIVSASPLAGRSVW